MKPKNYYMGGGVGLSKHELNAFDAALLSAKVGNYNLVRVSSILPPQATKRDFVSLQQGSILYTAYSTMLSNKDKQTISSGVGVAVPHNLLLPGVIMEYSTHNNKQVVRGKLQEMLEIAMIQRGVTEYSTDFFVIDAIVDDLFTCTFAFVSIW